jgi:hypothetical protein
MRREQREAEREAEPCNHSIICQTEQKAAMVHFALLLKLSEQMVSAQSMLNFDGWCGYQQFETTTVCLWVDLLNFLAHMTLYFCMIHVGLRPSSSHIRHLVRNSGGAFTSLYSIVTFSFWILAKRYPVELHIFDR